VKRNLAVSVRMRLLTLSKERGMVYNQALVRYALEGLLLRLSLSRHADRFILKGAMLYVLWQPDAPPRATQDLDLLCFGRPEPAFCLELFEEIAQVELDGHCQLLSPSWPGLRNSMTTLSSNRNGQRFYGRPGFQPNRCRM